MCWHVDIWYNTAEYFFIGKATEWGDAVASSIDDNAADGNLDKWNVLLISVGYTRAYRMG